ncbi:hypothetical protein AD945_03215 [Gluconobacter albidus]|uniref:Uncharacterized protein n=1 Tax=Gluconobacter albidus TaxID=318683 RepID=A0A149TLU9_9PROT|nr:hypothetical protein [Gluconobacter albidus]KXV49867.1 hypothetical protein AD945_03215 [Gluconobacter albidus]
MSGTQAAAIAYPALRRPPIQPTGLTPTQWSDAAEKAKIGSALLSFIARGFPQSGWNRKLYERLSSMFGHIAHYDVHGFWGAQFSTTEARRDFLRNIVLHRCYGDPAWTWSDVEREIRDRIIGSGLVEAYDRALRAEHEAQERAELARLANRFRIELPLETQPDPAPPVQVELF